MEIVVALDGSKRRDLQFFTGDELQITVKVYAQDGDLDPIEVTDPKMTTIWGADVALGSELTWQQGSSRQPYSVTGVVNGERKTLVYGYLLSDVGYPVVYCWPYWPGYPGFFPTPIFTALAVNIRVQDVAEYFTGEDVETVLAELGLQYRTFANGIEGAAQSAIAAAQSAVAADLSADESEGFRNQSQGYAMESLGHADDAEQSAVEAEQAKEAAYGTARMYDTTSDGIAATTDGQFFSVPAVGGFDIYKNVAGVATFVDSFPNSDLVMSLQVAVDGKLDRVNTRLRGYSLAVLDEDGRPLWIQANDIDGGPTPYVVQMLTDYLNLASKVDREQVNIPGVQLWFGDQNGNPLWIQANDTNGWPTQYTIDVLREVLGLDDPTPEPVGVSEEYLLATPSAYGNTPTILTADKWFDGLKLRTLLPNMAFWAGWGSSTMQNFTPQINTLAATFGVTYHSGGVASQSAENIASRMGFRPALVTFPSNQIPASGAVNVTVSNMKLISTYNTAGSIAGIKGVLTCPSGTYIFTRTTAGSVVAVAPGVEFLPDVGPTWAADMQIFNIGKNSILGVDGDVENVINITDQAVQWHSPLIKRIIFLNHYCDRDWAVGDPRRAQVLAINKAWEQKFGPNVLDVQGYQTKSPEFMAKYPGRDVWIDTGITPTTQDLANQATGNMPPSLASDAVHQNPTMRTAVCTYLIRPKLIELGYYPGP